MKLWLLRHWPRCKPYDDKFGLCLSEPVWNGRCSKHVRVASLRGEQI